MPTPTPIQFSRTACISTIVLTAALAACGTSPTGHKQLKLFPSDEVAKMGDTAYAQLKQKEPVARGTPTASFIECVARAVTAVAPAPKGGDHWEVTVFESDQVNAFALPGGNIGVYTGLLKAARTAGQLAAVIGHEISHVQAEHANARLSTQYATEAGLSLVQALGQGTALQSQQAMALLGLGAQVGVLLPFSRSQESEADVLGLTVMAQAGFNPEDALQLWRNMAETSGGGGPAFLSTHPSDEKRLATLQGKLPQAREDYRKAQAQGRRPQCSAPG